MDPNQHEKSHQFYTNFPLAIQETQQLSNREVNSSYIKNSFRPQLCSSNIFPMNMIHYITNTGF